MSVAEASSGFRRMLDLVLIVIDINKDMTYVIDEIEQKTKEIERRKVNKFLVKMAKEYGFQLAKGYGWTGASNIDIPE